MYIAFTNLNETTRMPLTGFRLVHVPRRVVEAYTYRRKFTIKDKADSKPKKAKKAAKAPGKRKKKAGGYNFATPSTGKHVYL